MNAKQVKVKSRRVARKMLELRTQLWPHVTDDYLWLRKTHDGYVTAPRTLPLILQIMDQAAPKGGPVSSTYLALWCRAFDEMVVTVNSEYEMATESGFSGQRAALTWRSRIATLKRLGFIDVKPGAKSERNYILLYNPYRIISAMNKRGEVQERKYNSLFARAQDVGARDLLDGT